MEKSLELVRQLVNDFREHEKAYLSPSYQESQIRQDFIDKFFTALGWDVSHQRQKNPYEQEVKIENKVSTQGSQRRADYAFFIAPNYRDVKFFVEAKKPAHDLTNANYYYQTVRYGWNKTTPIAILTDFEEFHILGCRYKPNIKTALDHKIEMFHYSQYTDEEIFKKIFYLFSRDAVAGGSLEKFAETLSKPRGKGAKKGIIRGRYQQVDDAFLELLDGYRDTLAHAFKNKNPNLDGEALTEAVQRTLDRLVFVRFLEDKGIEEPMIINLSEKQLAWEKFLALCRSMEPKYNGLVFKQHPVIDSPTFVAPDDKTFGEICGEISDPTSPYDFNTIPISILGSIYERFLGKIVTTTDKRAKVVEKPEVRKAGGVYYTPEYIVRYIVSETVGKLLYETTEQPCEGSEPSQGLFRITPAEVAKLKIIDIACGSGSFLLEVYSQLLDYHTRYYNEFPEKAKKGDTETREGKIVLSHKKRQEILVNNIYGVDIDFQATEVTQLSLYLKLMEDVTMNDAYQFSLLKERMLPDLRRNIVCGNSLIGRDILDGKLFDDETEHTLKPMNFEDAFPEIMKGKSPLLLEPVLNGVKEEGEGEVLKDETPSQPSPKRGRSDSSGFDVVVGNPPYIRIQALKEFNPTIVDLLNKKYKSAGKGNYDIYVVFVERALSLLNKNGMLGYILPHKFFNAQYGESLRDLIAKGKHLSHIVHFGDQQVFDGATTYTCLLFLQSSACKEARFVKVDDLEIWRQTRKAVAGNISIASVSEKEWNFTVGESSGLFEKLMAIPIKLGNVAERMSQGIRTSANEVYVLDIVSEDCDIISAYSKLLQRTVKLERKSVQLFLQGREIKQYQVLPSGKVLIMPYRIDTNGVSLIGQKEYEKLYPKTFAYLGENKVYLQSREKGRFRNSEWYVYGRNQNIDLMLLPKVLVPDIADRASFAFDANGEYAFTSGYGITLKKDVLLSVKYVLGVLNSKLLDFFLKRVSTTMRGGFFRYFTQFIEQLPIRTINFEDAADKAHHDNIVKLVEQMLAAKAKHATATTESEKNRLDIQIEALDRQIDNAVYELYGLTEEERRIVEEKL